MVAGNDDAAVAREASEDSERGRAVEAIIRIEFRHLFVRLGIGRHLQIAVDSEHLPDRHFHIRQTGFSARISCESHCFSVTVGAGAKNKSQARIGRRLPAAQLALAESSEAAKAT